jgi:Na+-translocating ferredoxin:NAD+ oxidoreductase RnfC subunit
MIRTLNKIKVAMFTEANVSACVECGLCDQICRSNLPLLQGVRAAQEIMANKAAKKTRAASA